MRLYLQFLFLWLLALPAFARLPHSNVTANGELGADTYGYGVRMPHAVKTVGSIRSYGYDANGNMISRYGQKLDYDSENRLSRVSSLTSTNTFGYAGSGMRLWKEGPGGLQVWIGGFELKQGKSLFHIMAGSLRICTFDSTKTNVFEYYHPDHLHSTAILTDQNGVRIQHHEYSAFGRDRFTDSTTAFPLSHRFTGQILDEDTGLYHYGARYYDPEIARFIQPDSIIPDFANPQSLNRYSYVYNNPLKYVDPSGHEPIYSYIPGLGPAIAALKGEWAANEAAKRLGERSGRGWLTYDAAIRELRLEKETGNGIYTAADTGAIGTAALVTGAAADGYLMGVQEIATAGIATVASPSAANKMGEVVSSSGVWSKFKSIVGKGGKAEGVEAKAGASIGRIVSTDYRATFFAANPQLQGQVVVHHAIEQQVLKLYPGRFTEAEIHSLQNLRGIAKDSNSSLHLSQIRKEWNNFYKSNPNATREQISEQAKRVDQSLGKSFNPPVSGGVE